MHNFTQLVKPTFSFLGISNLFLHSAIFSKIRLIHAYATFLCNHCLITNLPGANVLQIANDMIWCIFILTMGFENKEFWRKYIRFKKKKHNKDGNVCHKTQNLQWRHFFSFVCKNFTLQIKYGLQYTHSFIVVHGHTRMYPATKLHDSVHLVTHTLNSWKHEMHGIYKNEITQ